MHHFALAVDVGQPGEHARRRSGQFGFGQGAARGDGVSEGAALHDHLFLETPKPKRNRNFWRDRVVQFIRRILTAPGVVFPIGDVPQQVMDDFVDVPNGVTPKVQHLDPTKTLEIAVRDAIRTITSSIVNTVNHADDMLVMAN